MRRINKTIPNRIIIHARDIENITGLSARTAQRMLCDIRRTFDKQDNAMVTILEFVAYTGIEIELVREFLKN